MASSQRWVRARIVLSGVAPAPWRVPEAERAVLGKRLSARTARNAAAAAIQGAQALSGNGYKVELLRRGVEEALLSLV